MTLEEALHHLRHKDVPPGFSDIATLLERLQAENAELRRVAEDVATSLQQHRPGLAPGSDIGLRNVMSDLRDKLRGVPSALEAAKSHSAEPEPPVLCDDETCEQCYVTTQPAAPDPERCSATYMHHECVRLSRHDNCFHIDSRGVCWQDSFDGATPHRAQKQEPIWGESIVKPIAELQLQVAKLTSERDEAYKQRNRLQGDVDRMRAELESLLFWRKSWRNQATDLRLGNRQLRADVERLTNTLRENQAVERHWFERMQAAESFGSLSMTRSMVAPSSHSEAN